jgi:hypothetical protein
MALSGLEANGKGIRTLEAAVANPVVGQDIRTQTNLLHERSL